MTLAQSVTEAYEAKRLERDDAQASVAGKLDAVLAAFAEQPKTKGFFRKVEPVRGLYIHGPVGRGKSMLMDIFFSLAPVTKKRRVHFHAFMLEVHARLKAHAAKDDKLPAVAAEIARESRLLCFDEFQVTDIADAMLLGRLFTTLFEEGVVVIATSNRIPEELYKDGLQRDRFLPFIALIREKLDIVELAGAKDYRLEHLKSLETVWFTPLGEQADDFIAASFREMTGGAKPRMGSLQLPGRVLPVPRQHGEVAWFTFAELCEKPLGAADYIELAREFHTLLVQDIPVLSPEKRNEAKRFVMLVDELYEHGTNLIATAAALPQELYPKGDGSFEFERTTSRLMEMQSSAYLGGEHRA